MQDGSCRNKTLVKTCSGMAARLPLGALASTDDREKRGDWVTLLRRTMDPRWYRLPFRSITFSAVGAHCKRYLGQGFGAHCDSIRTPWPFPGPSSGSRSKCGGGRLCQLIGTRSLSLVWCDLYPDAVVPDTPNFVDEGRRAAAR